MSTHHERLLAEAVVKIAAAAGAEVGPLTGPQVLLLADETVTQVAALTQDRDRWHVTARDERDRKHAANAQYDHLAEAVRALADEWSEELNSYTIRHPNPLDTLARCRLELRGILPEPETSEAHR